MRILYIWDADYPWDVRVEKICRSLVAQGHEVHVAARNLKRRPVYESHDGLHIHRLRSHAGQSWNYAMSFPAFFSPIWAYFLRRLIRDASIDVVIVRDLPLAIAGLWAARRYKIPVIFDNAEDYVAMVRVMWEEAKFKGLNLIVRNPALARTVERYVMPKVDHILVVSDEMVEVCKRAGGDAARVTVVRNTPLLASFMSSPRTRNIDLSPLRRHWSVIYAGGLEASRGLELVMQAIPSLVRHIPTFLFVILGDGPNRARLERAALDLGVQAHVWFVGWVDHAEIFDYIRASNVGVIPHIVSEHVNTTIPNKIYDYMGCGIPVVASDARPMKNILDQVRAGLVFRSGDPQDLARAVLEVSRSETDFGARGAQAVLGQLNWSVDEAALASVVDKVARRGGCAPE